MPQAERIDKLVKARLVPLQMLKQIFVNHAPESQIRDGNKRINTRPRPVARGRKKAIEHQLDERLVSSVQDRKHDALGHERISDLPTGRGLPDGVHNRLFSKQLGRVEKIPVESSLRIERYTLNREQLLDKTV